MTSQGHTGSNRGPDLNPGVYNSKGNVASQRSDLQKTLREERDRTLGLDGGGDTVFLVTQGDEKLKEKTMLTTT